jgi:hypothetical protein
MPRRYAQRIELSISSETSIETAGTYTLANSDYPNHTVQTRALHAYLRRRNAHARHPDVLAAQRRERARVRSEKGIRWGGRSLASAA